MDKANTQNEVDQNKRDFVKKAVYTAPAIITMAALPSFASAGSGWQRPTHPSSQSLPSGRSHRGSGRR